MLLLLLIFVCLFYICRSSKEAQHACIEDLGEPPPQDVKRKMPGRLRVQGQVGEHQRFVAQYRWSLWTTRSGGSKGDGAGAMAQLSRVLAAVTQNLGVIPTIHIGPFTTACNSSSKEYSTLLVCAGTALKYTGMHAHTHACAHACAHM